ncbi:MAG: hypothetical protein KatS3mg009_1727 [Acidimicrobiia bacterium]|nr:MAG: hypothetical protein KatS3mg009_1727 [Acidimicrobiia bacterium]
MAYPRKLIREGEEVVLDLKPHWWFFWRQLLSGVALLVLLVLLWRWSAEGALGTVTWWAWGIAAIVFVGWLGIAYLNWQFTYFVLTTSRVVYRTGVLAKQGVEIPLDRINNINFRQGIVDRLVGAGSLEVESAGQDGETRFTDVRHPDAVQQEIYKQMEEHAKRRAAWGREAAAPQAAAPPNVAEQIRQLAELRDKGLITPAEYEAKKAELLERM